MIKFTTVEDVCEIVTDGTHYTPKNVGSGIPFLTVKDVTDSELDFTNCSLISDVDYQTAKLGNSAPQKGDVLFSKDGTVGKVHVVATDKPFAVLSSLAILRPKTQLIEARYLGYALRSPFVLEDALKRKTGSAIRRIILSDLKRVRLPLPLLEEQKRIAEILDRAQSLISKRREAIAQLDTLTKAIFLEMFGDPVSNSKGWASKALTDVCYCYSGGTPSKSNDAYWQGTLPWFSAKDLKLNDLFDSQDHINEDIPAKTTLRLLPENTVVIVVRGMILAHTFPISVLRVPATINQDLKALLPNETLEAQFLAASLRSVAAFALQQVSEAAHGTKRLDAEGLRKIPIILPPLALQKEFARRAEAVEKLKASHRASLSELDALFASLQYRAFRGEL